jgi:1-aminocyclopropane-1-carboxylate deaminase
MMIDLQTYSNWVADKLKNSVVEPFNFNLNNLNFELFIKRDDLIHPIISGNKLRKLKHNIFAAHKNECQRLVTFGGAYSNHILATAFLCVEFSIPLTVMVRGDELNDASNKILSFCSSNGIDLIFLTRDRYFELKRMNGVEYWLNEKCWFIPEGGANQEGIRGASEIIENKYDFDAYVVAQGTTTTSLGIYHSMSDDSTLFVVPALRNFQSEEEMKKVYDAHLLSKKVVPLMFEELGRYGKLTKTLEDFQRKIECVTSIKLDPIYTVKALYALTKFASTVNHKPILNKKVLFVHTGGLNQEWWN